MNLIQFLWYLYLCTCLYFLWKFTVVYLHHYGRKE